MDMLKHHVLLTFLAVVSLAGNAVGGDQADALAARDDAVASHDGAIDESERAADKGSATGGYYASAWTMWACTDPPFNNRDAAYLILLDGDTEFQNGVDRQTDGDGIFGDAETLFNAAQMDYDNELWVSAKSKWNSASTPSAKKLYDDAGSKYIDAADYYDSASAYYSEAMYLMLSPPQ
jgi:hypothetical protein